MTLVFLTITMKISTIFLITLFLFFVQMTFAQNSRQSGWVLGESQLDTSLLYRPSQGKSILKEKIDLTPYCPRPGDQFSSKSCVGWATSYAAMTILQAVVRKRKGKTSINSSSHSAKFIYNHLFHNAATEKEVSIPTYLEEMQQHGVCLERTFPSETPYQRRPDRAAYLEASQYKVGEYKILFEPSLGMDDIKAFFNRRSMEEYKIFITKTLLQDSFPVVIGFNTPFGFEHLRSSSNEVWKSPMSGQINLTDIKHAMTVVGYDDNDQSFTLMNSYGEQWGYNGFLKIHYNAFARLAVQACVFSIKEKGFKGNTDLIGYASSFHLQTAGGITSAEPAVVLDSITMVYSLNDPSALQGQPFQVIRNMKVGDVQFYVFNMNAEGGNVIEIPAPHETIFPDIGRFLQIERGKEEYLILVVSNFDLANRALTGGQPLLDRLKMGEGEALQKINLAFSPWLLPEDQVTYEQGGMRVYIKSVEGKHFIVPIILKIASP